MSTPVFSSYPRSVLQAAGWYMERSVDISIYVGALRAEGYVVFPVVRDFLKHFGGLIITWTTAYEGKFVVNEIHFDAAAAAAAVYPEQIAEYAQQIGVPLCVIGESDRKNVTLMMDHEGRVYGGTDHFLWLDGETGWQAIENLITGKNKKQLLPTASDSV